MAQPIRITDLAAPILTPMQAGAVAHGNSAPASMTVDQVLDAARAATGLSDFGADDFRARLGLWLQSIAEDKGLTGFGRGALFADCVRLASNRLKVEDLLKRHPEILDIKIDRPIIIAGLPRSGTTHLVNIISADSRLRHMPLWESQEPVPSAADIAAVKRGETDPRFVRARDGWGQFEAILPHMPAMHEMAPDHTHEEIELQSIDFGSYTLEWLSRPHRWREHYYATDQTPRYAYSKKVLQILTWYKGPNRWILKSPQHMEQLGPLKSVFPDATLVITHRDPLAVIQSAVTMLAYGDRIRRNPTDPHATARYWIDRVEHLLRACVRDRGIWGEHQSMDVLFHKYMSDEDSVLREVYRLADLEMTPAAEAELKAYLAANPRGKHGRVQYDLAGDFGVDIKQLRERFQFYFDEFPVEHEL
ncbi:MAG: sulfotransferase [Rhodospirillaceae bacterium]|nr:sulfotransferase [Rhodospirillaceae bacterium]